MATKKKLHTREILADAGVSAKLGMIAARHVTRAQISKALDAFAEDLRRHKEAIHLLSEDDISSWFRWYALRALSKRRHR